MFGAQIHQESAWNEQARSGVGAMGLSQFMPGTAADMGRQHGDLAQVQPLNPQWAIRAMIQYDRDLHDTISAATECHRLAMTLSCYNGGCGWLARDKALAQKTGRDPTMWWGNVELVNSGRSAAAWNENRGYPKRILLVIQPQYASWGNSVCREMA